MGQTQRTVPAERDLLEIWVHIAEESFEAADRLLDTIDETCRKLADTPGLGRRREELAAGLRSFPVGNYVIFYRPIEDGIEVVRVLHGARSIENLFGLEDEAE
jgi:toxin ParE1/3/4